MGLPPYCVLGDAGNVESCISHASYMFLREEHMCITQNAVQNFIQQTPFLSGNTSEILSFFKEYFPQIHSLNKQCLLLLLSLIYLMIRGPCF